MVFEKLCSLISDQFGVDENSLELTTSFYDDLQADSLDLVDLVMSIEEEFDLPEIEENVFGSIKTIGDAVSIIKDALE